MVCYRQRAITASQLMGTLPLHRVESAGPISLKNKAGRGRILTTKGYIVVIVLRPKLFTSNWRLTCHRSAFSQPFDDLSPGEEDQLTYPVIAGPISLELKQI